jgi:hypothetical protein
MFPSPGGLVWRCPGLVSSAATSSGRLGPATATARVIAYSPGRASLSETRVWIGPVQVRRGPDRLRQDTCLAPQRLARGGYVLYGCPIAMDCVPPPRRLQRPSGAQNRRSARGFTSPSGNYLTAKRYRRDPRGGGESRLNGWAQVGRCRGLQTSVQRTSDIDTCRRVNRRTDVTRWPCPEST